VQSVSVSSLAEPADREFFYRSSTTRAAFGTAGKGSPASRVFTSPDLIALHRIYTIALYVNYPIQSYEFYFFVSRQDGSSARLEVRPAHRGR
jgi:hypothetical protein